MGHHLLGLPPRSKKWLEVVLLLNRHAEVRQVAQAVLAAAHQWFAKAFTDPGLREATFLLVNVPEAARSDDYLAALRNLGLPFQQQPTLFEFVAACSDAIDRVFANQRGRTDLGEIAQAALGETLVAVIHPHLDGLFGSTAEDFRRVLGQYHLRKAFGDLARVFFTQVVCKGLNYFLSRHQADATGPGRRFATLQSYSDFKTAIYQHCWEMAAVLPNFANEWVSSKKWKHGAITRGRAAEFAYGAIEKLLQAIQEGKNRDAA